MAPADGVLLFELLGTNVQTYERHDVGVKDISLTVTNYINNSTTIQGQRHTNGVNLLDPLIKALQKNDKLLDDSPRNTIAGTLFTDALINFDYTDINTGEHTQIGHIAFIRTVNWHNGANAEALPIGNVIARERLQMLYTTRYMREGTGRNVMYKPGEFISLLTLLKFEWLPGRNFLARGLTIDYMNNSFSGRLQEIYKDDESNFLDNYFFEYVYKSIN